MSMYLDVLKDLSACLEMYEAIENCHHYLLFMILCTFLNFNVSRNTFKQECKKVSTFVEHTWAKVTITTSDMKVFELKNFGLATKAFHYFPFMPWLFSTLFSVETYAL